MVLTCEIVVFSSNYSPFVAPIVERLDPYHSFWSGALFREHTRYIDGKVVKVPQSSPLFREFVNLAGFIAYQS